MESLISKVTNSWVSEFYWNPSVETPETGVLRNLSKIYDGAFEAATTGVLWKKLFLEISQNSQENICARVSFLKNLQTLGHQLSDVFSCEISKNTFCTEYLWTTTSESFSAKIGNCYELLHLLNNSIVDVYIFWKNASWNKTEHNTQLKFKKTEEVSCYNRFIGKIVFFFICLSSIIYLKKNFQPFRKIHDKFV